MRSKILSILLLIVMVATACTTQATPTTAPVAAVETEAPTLVATAEPTTPAESTATVEPKTVTVLAAASLTESFTELGSMFEAQNAGVTVSFNFAGSQALAEQLNQGADADVFASASKKYMDAAVEAQRVNADDAQTFVYNRLVVIYPKDNPANLTKLQDLANAGVKIDLGDESVPVGQYALNFLDKAVQDSSFDSQYKDNVLANVVSYEDNVKSIVTKVSLGEGDAGIVYVTDVTADVADSISMLEIPDALNTIATYPIAPITDSKNPDLAQAFVDLVMSADGQAVMAKYGFTPAVESASATGSYTVTDALGREVTFNSVPQHIVLAGKALFMIADAIYMFPEAGNNIVALGSTAQGSGDFIPMIDPTFEAKITLGSEAGAEQIAAAQPDCVIMKSSNAETLGASLEAIDIPVVYLDFENPDQYQRDLTTLGQLFQNPDRAKEVAAFYQNKADEISQTVSSLKDDEKPRTLILYYSDKDGTVAFNVPPMDWIQTQMVESAGGTPVWQDANPGSGWTKVSFEQVAAWDPEYIFVVSYKKSVDEVVDSLKADAQWQALSAVKDGKVYPFATDVYSWDEADARWILGLTWMASILHPDLFPNLDIQQEAQTFYSTLYGMDEAAFTAKILPLFSGGLH